MRGHRLTEARNQPPGELPSGSHCNLLPQDGAHCQLEPGPRAGETQPGSGLDQTTQKAVGAEMRHDRKRIRFHVEHASDAVDDGRQRVDARKVHAERQLSRAARFDADDTVLATH